MLDAEQRAAEAHRTSKGSIQRLPPNAPSKRSIQCFHPNAASGLNSLSRPLSFHLHPLSTLVMYTHNDQRLSRPIGRVALIACKLSLSHSFSFSLSLSLAAARPLGFLALSPLSPFRIIPAHVDPLTHAPAPLHARLTRNRSIRLPPAQRHCLTPALQPAHVIIANELTERDTARCPPR